jgi:hypothetical protein
LLVSAAMAAHAPLYYQLPRWANGLDPTFVHPTWIKNSPFPLVLHLAAIHPLIWMIIIALIFIRICQNYGWKLNGSNQADYSFCAAPTELEIFQSSSL